MSIKDVIRDEVAQGRLVIFQPRDRASQVKRHVFIHEEIDVRLKEAPTADDFDGLRFGYLQVILESFVFGEIINISMNPDRKKSETAWARMKPVSDEIWDVRVVGREASLRVLGGFAMPDVFIGLEYEFRDNLEHRGDGPKWKAFVNRAKSKWRNIFTNYQRHTGTCSSDYITENTVETER